MISACLIGEETEWRDAARVTHVLAKFCAPLAFPVAFPADIGTEAILEAGSARQEPRPDGCCLSWRGVSGKSLSAGMS